jgi:cytoskeletal protein CcmA (bactofilin family)
MNATRQVRILFSLLLALAFLWIVSAAQVAKASSLLPQGTLASGEVIDNDVFAIGKNVIIDGTVNGDVMVLGNQVQINGTVNGSLLAIGQQVIIQGSVSGTTYIAAISLELGSQAVLARNLYFVGASLTTQPGSTIQRDMNTICLGADLNGSVSRNSNATIGLLQMIPQIIKLLGGEVPASLSRIISGSFVPFAATGGLISPLFLPLIQDPTTASSIDTAALTAWSVDQLRSFGLLLVLSLVFYWLGRKPINRTTQALRARPLPALGYGLLALLITFNIFLVGLLVASLIFVIGLWLGNLGLWSFTLAFWALSYATLVFFLAALWFLVAYGTKLIIAYLVGSWLFEKITPKASLHPYIGLVVGVLIYVLLRSIPMLGWVLSVIVTAWGLGGLWLAYHKSPEQ